MCVGREQIYLLPEGDLGKGEGGCWWVGRWEKCYSTFMDFPWTFSVAFVYLFIFSLKELNQLLLSEV